MSRKSATKLSINFSTISLALCRRANPSVLSNEPRKTPELYNSIAKEAKAVRLQSAQRWGRLANAYITIGHLLSSLPWLPVSHLLRSCTRVRSYRN